MKFLKYAVLSLLVITVCKRITPENKSHIQKTKQKSLSAHVKKYDNEKKIATVSGTVFVGVHEHNSIINPISPAQVVPAMVPFGTIQTKNNRSTSDKFHSKFKDLVSLHGVPVDGPRRPIRKTHTNKVIGFVWQDQDQIKGQDYDLGVAQMHSGETYVGVKAVHLPNYIENHKSPHYNDDEKELLQHRYGIKKIEDARLLGTAKLGSRRHFSPYKRQNYILYGLPLPDLSQLNSRSNDVPFYKPKLTAHPIIAYHAIQKYLESKKGFSQQQLNSQEPISSRTAASAIFNPLF